MYNPMPKEMILGEREEDGKKVALENVGVTEGISSLAKSVTSPVLAVNSLGTLVHAVNHRLVVFL